MANLNSAIKRIENKGKNPVDPKKNEMTEVAPVVAGVGKAALVTGKAIAKGVAAGAKGGAKAAKVGAKAGKGAVKSASKATKPVARNLTKRRNVKNPKYRKPDGSFNKKLYDQDGNPKTQGYMSDIEKPTDSRADTASGSQRQTAKIQDAEKRDTEARDKKVQDTAQSLKKGVADAGQQTKKVVGSIAKKTARTAKAAVGGATAGFGASSFKKESKITFKDYLNKL